MAPWYYNPSLILMLGSYELPLRVTLRPAANRNTHRSDYQLSIMEVQFIQIDPMKRNLLHCKLFPHLQKLASSCTRVKVT